MRNWHLLRCAALASSMTGCFSEPQAPAEGTGGQSCVEGEQRACDCPSAPGAGVQVCAPGGGAFESCSCPGDDGSTSTDPASTGSTTTGPSSSGSSTSADTGSSSGSLEGTGTTEVTRIYLYTSVSSFDGDLSSGGGPGEVAMLADEQCFSDAPKALAEECTQFVAVLDTQARRLLDYAQLYGIADDAEVFAPQGLLLPEYGMLFEPGVELMNVPDTVGFVGQRYWTGAPTMAGDMPQNCEWWTTGGDAVRGGIGNAGRSDIGWFASRDAVCDEPDIHLLCGCW